MIARRDVGTHSPFDTWPAKSPADVVIPACGAKVASHWHVVKLEEDIRAKLLGYYERQASFIRPEVAAV